MYLYFLWPIPFWSRLWHIQRARNVKQSVDFLAMTPLCLQAHNQNWKTSNLTTPGLHWPSDNNLLGQSNDCLCPFASVSISVYDILIVACFVYLPCRPAPVGVLSLHPTISSNPTYNSFSNNPYLIPILTIALIFSMTFSGFHDFPISSSMFVPLLMFLFVLLFTLC